MVEIKRFLRRRKGVLIIAPLFFLGLSIAALYYLPERYQSEITILVERDETLNPMIQYSMAVAMASDDRLRSFNEILYSRSTISKLVDSLGLAEESISPGERESLLKSVRQDIGTDLRASDSFSISYVNEDPELAQQGVKLLSDHFIQTKLSLENRRNEQTLKFFESKLQELEEAVAVREQELMAGMQQNIETAPREDRSINLSLDRVSQSAEEVQRNITRSERALSLLTDVNRGERDIEALYEIDLSNFGRGEQLQQLLYQYQDYIQRYTPQYPGIRNLQNRIHETVEPMMTEIEATLFNQRSELAYLTQEQNNLVDQLGQTAMTDQVSTGIRGDYDVYKAMLDDMKVKVEQARSTSALGEMSTNQFVVIDAANLPGRPSEPNPPLMIAGGLFIGLFLGVIGAGMAEMLDTTIRKPEDLKRFNKPVIAFLPNSVPGK